MAQFRGAECTYLGRKIGNMSNDKSYGMIARLKLYLFTRNRTGKKVFYPSNKRGVSHVSGRERCKDYAY